jgi:hypothetical protein
MPKIMLVKVVLSRAFRWGIIEATWRELIMVKIVLGPCNVATEDDNRSRHPFVRAKQIDRLGSVDRREF